MADRTGIKTYQHNPQLSTGKAPEGWQGTPVDGQGRFRNLNHPFKADLMEVLRWQVEKNPFRAEKKATHWNPAIDTGLSWLTGNDDVMVWLGHCTFYIRVNGVQLLTDPVFGDILSVKRQSALPLDPQLFHHLDAILLSHDHRDHLDKKSLQLLAKQNPDTTYLTGLGMQKIVHAFTGSHKIEEAGWYQVYNAIQPAVKITFIPSRHWSKRGAFDTNMRLWGGFIIEVGGKRILFGGDSGYDTHFKQMGDVFGGFDYAMIGIGAYSPEWFMGANHQSPKEALQAGKDLRAKRFIPMHYATFDLSDEPMGQPLKELYAEAAESDLPYELMVPEIGKPIPLDISPK